MRAPDSAVVGYDRRELGAPGDMATLEDLQAGASIRGLAADGLATVVQVEWFGD
jgi:hypothetical protein